MLVFGYMVHTPDRSSQQPHDEVPDSLQDLRYNPPYSNDFLILLVALAKYVLDALCISWACLLGIKSLVLGTLLTSIAGLLQFSGQILGVVAWVLRFLGLGSLMHVKSWWSDLGTMWKEIMRRACHKSGMDHCDALYRSL